MAVLTRYLNGLFLRTLAITIFAILAFALLFDLLDVSDDLLHSDLPPLVAFGRYILLRLPTLFSESLPIASLIAGLFMAAGLLRNSEMTVIWASGVSILSVMSRLLPAALLVLVVKFANDDLLVPHSIEQLRAWNVGNFKNMRLGVGSEFIWFRKDDRIYRLPLTDYDESTGTTLTVFELDQDGKLVSRGDASGVLFNGDKWHLSELTNQVGGQRETERDITIAAPMDPTHLDWLYRPPQELSAWQLADVIIKDGYGAIPTERHRTWLYQRIVGAVAPMLLALLAFAMARRFDRRQGAAVLFLKGIGVGFGYVIANGLMLALGEAGFITPALASFGPLLLLLAFVLAVPLWQVRPQMKFAQ